MLASWPATDEPDEQRFVVNAALNMLLGYPHNQWDGWSDYVSVPPKNVAAVYARWRGEDTLDPSGEGFFDRLV